MGLFIANVKYQICYGLFSFSIHVHNIGLLAEVSSVLAFNLHSHLHPLKQ